MAAVVKAVEFFKPCGRTGKQIAYSRDIVRKDRSGGPGKKLGKGVMAKKRRAKQQEKKAEGQNLVGQGHGQDSLESDFSSGCGGDPVTDAGVPVGDGVEKQMAGHSRHKSRHGTAGESVSQKHPDRNMDGREHAGQPFARERDRTKERTRPALSFPSFFKAVPTMKPEASGKKLPRVSRVVPLPIKRGARGAAEWARRRCAGSVP